MGEWVIPLRLLRLLEHLAVLKRGRSCPNWGEGGEVIWTKSITLLPNVQTLNLPLNTTTNQRGYLCLKLI